MWPRQCRDLDTPLKVYKHRTIELTGGLVLRLQSLRIRVQFSMSSSISIKMFQDTIYTFKECSIMVVLGSPKSQAVVRFHPLLFKDF